MKLSRTERLILSNQLSILMLLDSGQKDIYKRDQEIFRNGYELLYDECMQGVYPDDEIVSEDECRLTLEILGMFRAITLSFEKIEDKSGLNLQHFKFEGFDGNNEGKFYSFAKFFCTEYKGCNFPEIGTGVDNFNSHAPLLDSYVRMLETWNACEDRYKLTKDELIQISQSAIHPSNR